MSPPLLARLLRLIRSYLTSIRTYRPISLLFRLLAFLGRQLFGQSTKHGRSAPKQRRGHLIPPPAEQDGTEKISCAMSLPYHDIPDPRQGGGSSPIDMPYNTCSSSHLDIVPHSPVPSRRFTQEQPAFLPSTPVSLNQEPSPIESETPPPALHSILRPTSANSNRTHGHNVRMTPDLSGHIRQAHSPQNKIVAFAPPSPQMLPGSPLHRTASPNQAHSPRSGAVFEFPRSTTPVSYRSTSQLSVSQRSYRSTRSIGTVRSNGTQGSIGRASYRRHEGIARSRTPVRSPGQFSSVLESGSSTTLQQTPTPVGSQVHPGRLVAVPDQGDPNHPGRVTVDYGGPRFAPMSANGVLRYDRHNLPNVIKRPSEFDYCIPALQYEYPAI
ncbi:hypothetical protein HYDPIDRAFT_137479, partial [Hydnomerulius pinastri MD-312]